MKLRPQTWKAARFRGVDHEPERGRRYIRTMDRQSGATVLAPVEIVEDLTDGSPGVMPGECEHPPLACWTDRSESVRYDFGCLNCGVAGPGGRTFTEARRAFLRAFPPAGAERRADR